MFKGQHHESRKSLSLLLTLEHAYCKKSQLLRGTFCFTQVQGPNALTTLLRLADDMRPTHPNSSWPAMWVSYDMVPLWLLQVTVPLRARLKILFWLQGLFWTNSTKSSPLVYILPLTNIFQRGYFVKFGGKSPLAPLYFEPWLRVLHEGTLRLLHAQ